VPVLVLVSVSVSDLVTTLSVSVDVAKCWVTVSVSVAVVSLPNFFCLCSSMELPLLAAASAAASALDVVDGSSFGCLPPSLGIEGSLLLPLTWAGVAGGAGVAAVATAAAVAPSVCDGFTSLTTTFSSVGDVCVVVVALALAFRPLNSGRSTDLVVTPFSVGLLGVAAATAAAGDSWGGSGVEETESNRGSCSDELVDVANCCVVSRVYFILVSFYTL